MTRKRSTANERKSYTVKEAAKIAGFGVVAMYKGIREGTVPHIRMGRRIMIPRTALDRWLDTAGGAFNSG